jgi:hypothetical protein
MSITPLPDPPSRSDPTNFPERADAFMAALPQFAEEANVLQEQVNEAAEAVGADATAAAASAGYADGRAGAASASASQAAGSASGAGTARSQAEAARDLAQDWAAKASGTVGGTAFKSAFQYAQDAAAGAGLPIRPFNVIPTADQGPIYVPTQGAMEWNGSRYVCRHYDHGQCQFRWVSATECRLFPKNGNGLIINGRQYRIPAAGISIGPQAASLQSYVYAKDDGSGGIALEAPSILTAPHSAHTDGVEIKSGDPSRTLVAFMLTNSLAQFTQPQSTDGVTIASWFHRRRLNTYKPISSTSFANTTDQPISPSVAVFNWNDETTICMIAGYCGNSLVGGGWTVYIGYDGISGGNIATPVGSQSAFANQTSSMGWSGVTSPGSGEGMHSYAMRGNVSGGVGNIQGAFMISSNV